MKSIRIAILVLAFSVSASENPIYLSIEKSTSMLFIKHLNFNAHVTTQLVYTPTDNPLASVWYVTADYYGKLGKDLRVRAIITFNGKSEVFDYPIRELVEDIEKQGLPTDLKEDAKCQEGYSLAANIERVDLLGDTFLVQIHSECQNDKNAQASTKDQIKPEAEVRI